MSVAQPGLRPRKRFLIGTLVLLVVAVLLAAGIWKGRFYLARQYDNLMDPPQLAADRGNGGPATEIVLFNPAGMTKDDSGNVYIADRGREPTQGSIIWKVDPQGMAQAVAGTGRRGDIELGIPALETDLGVVENMTIGPNGRLYFADHAAQMVLRIENDGTLSRIAGNGVQGGGGDGGSALEAQLNWPYDVQLDSKGNVYIADTWNHRVRMVTPEGVITTAAGTGEQGNTGDNGPATEATLSTPYNIRIDNQDRLMIATGHAIRRVGHDGTITTIVGTGNLGYSGDGGPALEAEFDTPQAMFLTETGFLYVGDEHNHAVRVIDPSGNVSHFMGTGQAGLAPEGAPASEAPLNDPEGIQVLADGTVIVLDGDNGRVLRIGADNIVRVFAGRGRSSDAE